MDSLTDYISKYKGMKKSWSDFFCSGKKWNGRKYTVPNEDKYGYLLPLYKEMPVTIKEIIWINLILSRSYLL